MSLRGAARNEERRRKLHPLWQRFYDDEVHRADGRNRALGRPPKEPKKYAVYMAGDKGLLANMIGAPDQSKRKGFYGANKALSPFESISLAPQPVGG